MNLDLFKIAAGRPTEFGRISPPDEAWLNSVPVEPALLPDLPIVDPHHHLWDHPGMRYLIEDYAADARASGHRIEATVHADCVSMYRARGPGEMKPVGETEFIVGQAAMADSGRFGPTRVAAAMIGWADLRLGADVARVLEAHVAASNGRFRSVRLQASYDPSGLIVNGPFTGDKPGMLLDPQVQAGAGVLARMGLVLDVWVFFHQIHEDAALADAIPGLTIVLNHCGGPLGYGPYAKDQAMHYALWRRQLNEVARRPNVVCKAGGIMGRGAAYDYLSAPVPASSEELARIWAP